MTLFRVPYRFQARKMCPEPLFAKLTRRLAVAGGLGRFKVVSTRIAQSSDKTRISKFNVS
jgi:hypothetical protein